MQPGTAWGATAWDQLCVPCGLHADMAEHVPVLAGLIEMVHNLVYASHLGSMATKLAWRSCTVYILAQKLLQVKDAVLPQFVQRQPPARQTVVLGEDQ